jgi:nucleoid-associated protein YgaU
MGLFDFAQNIGNKIFSDDEPNQAEKIYQYISDRNPGLDKFSVKVDDGVVTLVGFAQSEEAVQKAVLIAGNIQGVKEVISNMLVTSNAEADLDLESIDMAVVDNVELEPDGIEYYTINSGDTLSKIAKQFYGDAMAYPKIFEANREVIKDPDLIFVGQKIRIPLDG